MDVTEQDILDFLGSIETGDVTLTPDVDPQEQIKGDILFRASNGWTVEVSNWRGDFAGIVEITLPDGSVLDLDFLDQNMPAVSEYFPDEDIARRVYGMKAVECGFIYESADKPGQFAHAQPGEHVTNPTPEPPWIVVSHSLNDVTVAHWPGKLWLAQVMERLEPQDHRGNYTRSISVKILRSMETCHLFGPHGEAVEKVLNYASTMTLTKAHALAERRHEAAGSLQHKGWKGWLEETEGSDVSIRGQMLRVLAAGNRKPRSPIGHGFSQVHSLIWDAAKREVGDAAIEEDEDDCWLLHPWSAAVDALLDAAWAFGSPKYFNETERQQLLQAWDRRDIDD